MPPLPHRIRRLSLRVRATSPNQALALRKEVRDQLDTTLLAALERAFDKVGAPDELIHIPRVHVQAHISGKDDFAGELARCIEQELRKQLSTLAVTAGRANPALQTGPSGAERTGHSGFAGWAPSGTDAPAGEMAASLQTRARMLLHYLETGSLPWPLAKVDPAIALSELRDAASTDLPGMLDRLTGEPVSLPARVALWFRWLQLLPDASWPVLARAAAPHSSGQGARLAEIIGALSGAQAGALSRYARLQLAAAAIAWARRTGGLVDTGELASLVIHVLGGGTGRPGVIEWTERLAGTGASATSGSGAHARPSGGAGSLASGSGDGGRENDPTAPAGRRVVDAPGGGGTRGPDSSGASATSDNGSHARPSGGTDSHDSGSGDGARENDRASSTDRRVVAEEARLGAASGLTARLPEPAAAAFRAWLVAPNGPLLADAPKSPAAVETGATRTSLARGGPAEPRTGQPLPESDPATLPRDAREARSRDTDARRAPFGQMVHHAGLVLLHPFLPRFFESTAVKEAGKPALASGALPRAAALLHLLAVGEEEVFELELDFIKVLLGLPLDAPLPVSEGLLLASDREEAEALLSSVIGHWRVLKSTSVRGLRSSFLQRPGLLREQDQGFRLQVEPAPFDMLLGQLPWGIGTIKLPWMKKAIFTEWPAP
jgi:hypothetical protein